MSLAHALHSDWARMGLASYQPGQNAFTAVLPRSTIVSTATPPKKRGPRPQSARAQISMESFEERQARLSAKILKDNRARSCFNVDIPKAADAVKTAKIRGRSNDSRTQ